MDEKLETALKKKGIKVWIGFANDEAYDFSFEKGTVYLKREQAPFDDARPFMLRPFRKKNQRPGGWDEKGDD